MSDNAMLFQISRLKVGFFSIPSQPDSTSWEYWKGRQSVTDEGRDEVPTRRGSKYNHGYSDDEMISGLSSLRSPKACIISDGQIYGSNSGLGRLRPLVS
jgi:hypothetical protein